MTTWNPEEHVHQDIKDLIDRKTPNYTLALFDILHKLKLQRRTGWINNGIENPESISDHMYRMSIMSWILRSNEIDSARCMKISLAHDMAESIVGDITPFDVKIDKHEKHLRELSTIEYLCNELVKPYNPIAADDILAAWHEYEDQTTIEAKYVKDLDKFEMLVQCFEYERMYEGKKDLSQFYGCLNEITTDEVSEWATDLMQERSQYFDSLKE
ncbi:similar to Saccharomyces cerevisiae YGL101W Putative protein of unknown function [Maudiozyma saulgeensis]|uniref:5'-deoxynucleotidase n=1 Tax=Maudiozyma saulgeensis TaxID=1789683 RepID=A0A1X7R0K4_9SACH|nr:similar to Saccharomyces cerevisiae YGL101W Putative protein of unknown function [Kazachstania saulgeensis]